MGAICAIVFLRSGNERRQFIVCDATIEVHLARYFVLGWLIE